MNTKARPVDLDRRPGRNHPCPCGSGKKSKKCCYGPQDNTRMSVPYTPMSEMLPLTTALELNSAFIRRWGYTPGLAERSVMVDGTEDEMVEMVVRKLLSVNAAPQWIAAVRELKMLVTGMNVKTITDAEADAWNKFVESHAQELPEEMPCLPGTTQITT